MAVMAAQASEVRLVERIRELYPQNPTEDVCVKLNISKYKLRRICEKNRIFKEKEYFRKLRSEKMKAIYQREKDTEKGKRFYRKGENMVDKYGERGREIIERGADASYNARKKDEKRWLYGMPRKTNFRYGKGKSIYQRRGYLRKLGYEIDRASNIAYYSSTTRRSQRIENNYKNIVFKKKI